MDKIPTAPAEG